MRIFNAHYLLALKPLMSYFKNSALPISKSNPFFDIKLTRFTIFYELIRISSFRTITYTKKNTNGKYCSNEKYQVRAPIEIKQTR